LLIVHGQRNPTAGKVEQLVLFTLYSKAEAKKVLEERKKGVAKIFQGLLEHQYPNISFNWEKIYDAILKNMDVLPDQYEYKTTRVRNRLRKYLLSFTRQILLADPQALTEAASLLKQHRFELEYLADLVQWRLKLHKQKKNTGNHDDPFYWRVALTGSGVPPEIEEHASGFYQRGEYNRAEKVFNLLVTCFKDYAEGYNYLGLIALNQDRLEEAIDHFQKAVSLGSKLFPKHLPAASYWEAPSTRPYVRGLCNLATSLIRAGRYEEALNVCHILQKECGDDKSAKTYRALIYLNTGQWQKAIDCALPLLQDDPTMNLIAAFALFELKRNEEAFLYYMQSELKKSKIVRMLSAAHSPDSETLTETNDDKGYNEGINLLKSLNGYFKNQSKESRLFFQNIIDSTESESFQYEIT